MKLKNVGVPVAKRSSWSVGRDRHGSPISAAVPYRGSEWATVWVEVYTCDLIGPQAIKRTVLDTTQTVKTEFVLFKP